MKKHLFVLFLVNCIFSLFASDFETRFEGIRWLREYYNEVIQKKDRNLLLDYVPWFKEVPWIDYFNVAEEIYWYEDIDMRRDSCYYEYSDLSKMYFVNFMGRNPDVKSCDEIESNVYEIVLDVKKKISEELYNILLSRGCDWSALKDSVFDTFYFQFDGDYLYIYLADRKTLFATYCAYNESEYQALVEAVATDNFDNMEFTFPRHADGTCDYDESAWEAEKKSGGGTLLRTGKAITVKDNLRVLSDDRMTSAVRITLAAGTSVEILGVGDEETIDGITSKWVHVKVMPGTLGTDGTYIEWGNVLGWCFGGVVSDMEGMAELASETIDMEEATNAPATEEHAEPAEEAAESESPNEESESSDMADAAAKQNAALPILPIAAGGAALAILLAVVLLAAKRSQQEMRMRE